MILLYYRMVGNKMKIYLYLNNKIINFNQKIKT